MVWNNICCQSYISRDFQLQIKKNIFHTRLFENLWMRNPGIQRVDCIFTEKNPHINGGMQFKPMLFKPMYSDIFLRYLPIGFSSASWSKENQWNFTSSVWLLFYRHICKLFEAHHKEHFEKNECVVTFVLVIQTKHVPVKWETYWVYLFNILGFWDIGNPISVPHITKFCLDDGFSLICNVDTANEMATFYVSLLPLMRK